MSLHVIPIGNDEPYHSTTLECWCGPTQIEPKVIAHNARDNRERYERLGITHPDKKWVTVADHEDIYKPKEFTD